MSMYIIPCIIWSYDHDHMSNANFLYYNDLYNWSLITDRWSAIRSQHRNCTKMTCPAFSFCSCLYPGPCWTTTKYCMHLCIATPYIYIRTSTLLRMHMPHLYSYKYDIQCTNFVCTYSMYVIIFPSRTALHVYSIFGFSIHLGTNQIRVVESFIRVRNEMKNKTSGSCQVFIRVKNETSNPG